MLVAFFIFCCCSVAKGQVNSEFSEESQPSGEIERNQRFMSDLMLEAGRHVLFPKLYRDVDEGVKYYEMKGQPEYEEFYSNSRSDDCSPRECTNYKPVCGSDGKVYASECHLVRENCGKNNNVSRSDWSSCTGNHYLCPTRCLDLNEPVCGSDLKIYHNICLMRKSNCGKLLQKLPLSTCYEQFSQQQEKQCPDQCSPLPGPVCGSDGVIYFNECVMKMRTCKQGIVRVSMEGCLSVPSCPQVCLPLYDPVCGSDGSLYTNYCRMMQNNCGRSVKKMPLSFCSYAEDENHYEN